MKWGYKHLIVAVNLVLILAVAGCSTKKALKYTGKQVPRNASIAIIVDSPENLKNAVLVRFLSRGFNVKAVNASDFYSMEAVFDIEDMKRLSYNGDAERSIVAMERTVNNVYKLHVYNFELNKAEILAELRTKWDVQYLVLLELNDWEETSWIRVIDLKTYEIIAIENYPTSYNDTIETIVGHFIDTMAGSQS